MMVWLHRNMSELF